jgi:peptidoglycan hydrolase CwlO-like protein
MKTLKQWWQNLFKPQEVKMSTTAESRSVKALKRQVADQSDKIDVLRNRVGSMRDDIAIMERDIATFKSRVQSDIKMLVEKYDK